MCHEAQSLHLRYGLDIALSTLNSCRHLHEPKTRFPVGGSSLSGAGISPAESAGLSLAHRNISKYPQIKHHLLVYFVFPFPSRCARIREMKRNIPSQPHEQKKIEKLLIKLAKVQPISAKPAPIMQGKSAPRIA